MTTAGSGPGLAGTSLPGPVEAPQPSAPGQPPEPQPRQARPVIQLRRVFKTYQMGAVDVQALRGVSLTVERGDFVAIIGASGSGKSTMMNIIGCLDVPSRGRYWIDGVDVRRLDEEALKWGNEKVLSSGMETFGRATQSFVIEVGP